MAVKKKKISEYDPASSLVGLWTLGYSLANGVRKTVRVSLEFIKSAFDDTVAATKAANDAAAASKTQTENAAKAEALRVTAESARVTAENTRKSNEETRVSQETARVNTEKARVTAESGRVTAENARVTAENTRKSNEETRVSQETARVNAEKARVMAESGRVTAENRREEDTTDRLEAAQDATDRLNALSDHRDKIIDGFWWHWNEETGEYEPTGEQAHGNVLYATFEVDPETGELSMFTDDLYDGPEFELDNGILSVLI